MKTIDVHSHLYPQEWVDYLSKRTECPKIEKKGPSAMIFYSHDVRCSSADSPIYFDPAARIDDLDRSGIDVQILSLTAPGVEELPVDEGVQWAKKNNDYFAEVCGKYPGRFYAYASLPYQDVDEALKELDRAYNDLGVKGIAMLSHVNFKPLSSEEFFPIYEKASEYGLPVLIHPGVPFTGKIMLDHKIIPALYGFLLDTTMAVTSLIWSGVLEKCPDLKIIHGHLGGMVPYLVKRIEDCWQFYLKSFGGEELPLTPTQYYQRQVFTDTISGYMPAVKCCLDFVGPQQMVLGSDYPFSVGGWDTAVDFVKQIGLSQEDTNKILGETAARIFNIQ
jgi:aminocarboxymuconate-semialdehyde decarboxylase